MLYVISLQAGVEYSLIRLTDADGIRFFVVTFFRVCLLTVLLATLVASEH